MREMETNLVLKKPLKQRLNLIHVMSKARRKLIEIATKENDVGSVISHGMLLLEEP